MPDGKGKPVPDGNGKSVPEGRGPLNGGRPVGNGPWKLTPDGRRLSGQRFCCSAGAAKTATGARMATKRVNVLESCMLTDYW